MVGITTVLVMLWVVLVQTVATEAEEELQAQISKLKSQVKVLTDGLQEEKMKVSVLRTQMNMIQQRYENDTNFQPGPKDKVQRHGSGDLLKPYGRHSRSTDPVKVAFTAELTHELNNIPIHTTLRFDHRISWTDNSYDSSSGVFACPTSGLYLFAVFIKTHTVGTEAMVRLMCNGKSYMSVISERSDEAEDDTGGNVVLLPIVKGDRIWIETYGNDNQAFWSSFTTFSGVLIYRN